ncbi:MAG: 3-methyl-2-oxobutanoate hydroxymethyltransferase [Wenzhouxiangellaceae bacterium]
MSVHDSVKRLTAPDIMAMKGRQKIVSLTAHSKPIAELMDRYVDLIIMGDSLGMVVYGMPSTLAVTLEMTIAHAQAVMRGAQRACVVVDLPFASYQESPQQAFRSAARVMAETGAQAVKLEGLHEMIDTVRFLVQRGIPVMPHIGLMPQHFNVMGGFKVQAKTDAQADALVQLGRELEQAGAFSLLIEGTYASAATAVSEAVSIPTIGIGASAECDGQVLVTEDVIGLFSDFTPKFAKQYIDLKPLLQQAFEQYMEDVRKGDFPAREHCFGANKSS